MKTCLEVPELNRQELFRFLSYVDIRGPNECWEWLGGKSKKGYGHFKLKGRMVYAPRIACQLRHGDPPTPDLIARHSCDNPGCNNPHHLSWGTDSQNKRDFWQRGDTNKILSSIPKGEDNGQSRLTEHDVRVIQELLGNQYALAVAFGVSQSTISRIKNRKTWRHL